MTTYECLVAYFIVGSLMGLCLAGAMSSEPKFKTKELPIFFLTGLFLWPVFPFGIIISAQIETHESKKEKVIASQGAPALVFKEITETIEDAYAKACEIRFDLCKSGYSVDELEHVDDGFSFVASNELWKGKYKIEVAK